MAISSQPKFANIPKVWVGSGTALTAGAFLADTNGVSIGTASNTANGGTRVSSLLISTDDTAAVNIFLYAKSPGGVIAPIGNINIPIGSGTLASVPAVDGFSNSGATLLGLTIDAAGKRYIDLQQGYELKFSVLTTMTASKKISVTAFAADITV